MHRVVHEVDENDSGEEKEICERCSVQIRFGAVVFRLNAALLQVDVHSNEPTEENGIISPLVLTTDDYKQQVECTDEIFTSVENFGQKAFGSVSYGEHHQRFKRFTELAINSPIS